MTEEERRRREELRRALEQGGEQAQRIVDGISDEETRVQAQAILDRQSAAQTMRAGGGEALSLIRSMQTPEKRDAALRMYTDMTHDRGSELYDPEAMSYSEIKKSWEEVEEASRERRKAWDEKLSENDEAIKASSDAFAGYAASRRAIREATGIDTRVGAQDGQKTRLQTLSGIAAMTDTELQTRTMDAYLQGMQSQRSELYNPYMSGSTNSYAVKQLGQQEFTPEWMAQNRWMLEYLERDEVTGSPKKPGESSGEIQKKAYAYYLLTQDAERTEQALSQTQELLEDVRAQAERQGENFDPEMYVEMIDWDYYDVLAQMMEDAKTGTPTRLNQAAPFSIESIYGAAWAGMNGIEFSDPRELLIYAGSWENARREREAQGEPEKKGFWQGVAEWFTGGNQKTEQETAEQTAEPTPEPTQTQETGQTEGTEQTPEPEQTPETMEGMLVQTLAVDPRARLGVATNAAQAEQERKRQEQEQAQAMTPAQKREAFRRGDYTFVGNEEDIKTLQSLDAQIEAVNQSIQALETTEEYVDPQTGETLTATERTIRLDRLMEDRTRIEEQKAVIAFPAESAPDAESSTDAEQTQDVGERLIQQAEQERTALMEQKDAELTDAWTRYQNGEIGQGELQSEQARLELNEQRRIYELAERERAYEMNLPHDEETREIRAKADPKWVELLYELEYAVQAGDTELENNTREQLINAGYSEMWPEEVAALEQLERDQIEFAKQRGDAWTRGVLGLPEGSELTEEDYLKAGQNEVGFFESLAEQMKTIFSTEGKEKRQQAIKLMADAMLNAAQGEGEAVAVDPETSAQVWDLYARAVAGQEAGYLQIESAKDRLAILPALEAGAIEGAAAPVTSLPAAVAGLYRAANARRYGGGLTDAQLRAIDPTYDGMMNLSEKMTQDVSEAADFITAYAVTEERAGYVQSARSIGSAIATQAVLAWTGGGLGKALSANFARTIPQAAKLAERTRKLTQDVGMAITGYASGYQQAVQEGATADEAVGYGMAAAIISAGVERISDVGAMLTGGTADDALKGLSKYAQGHGGAARLGAQVVDAFAGEALEEAVEAPMQAAARKAIYDEDMPLTGEGGVFDLQEIAQNALQGGIAGAVLGGAGYATNARTEGQTERIDANGRIVYDTKTQQDERNGRQSVQEDVKAEQEAKGAQEGVQAAQETQTAQEAQGAQEGVQAAQETQGAQEKKSRQTQIRQERMGMAMEALGTEGSSARTQQIAQRLMDACLTTKKTDELARALSESMMQDAATGEAGAKAREAQQTAQTMRQATEQASAYTQGVEKRVEAQRRVTAAWGEDVANNPTKENVNRYNQDMNELTRLHREMESARANLRAMEKKAREAVQEAQEQAKQAKRKKEQLERTARRAQEKLDGLDESQWTQAYRAIAQRIEQARAEGKSAFSVLEEYADGKMDEQIAAQAKGDAQAQQEAQGAAQAQQEARGAAQAQQEAQNQDGQTSFFARSARRRGQTGTRAGRVKSEQQILEGLKKEFPGITVRRMSNQPNIQDEGARYDAVTGGVRVSGHQSVMAAVHEIGHKAATEAGIVTDVTRSEDGRIERVDIRPEARNAVDAMAQRMTPEERQGYRPGNEMRQEALAVFWERWMLSDDAAREYAGPLYEQLMAGVTRRQLRALRQARADIQARENASLAQRIGANIRMRSDLEKGKRKYTVGNAVSGVFDANHRAIDFDYASVQQKRKTMSRAQWRAYRRERGKNGQMLMDETDRLYLRMQALNGTGATAGFIATTQAVDPDGNPLRTADGRDVKSLAECLQDIPMTQEAMGELRAYIAIMQELDARRLAERRRQEAEETGRSEPDLATGGFYMTEYKGVTTQELEREAARLEGLHDGVYKRALEGMVELNDAVMRAWAINTGAAGITMEHYDEIVKARPHYVPTRTGGSLDIQERRQGGTIVKSETQINRARSGDVDLVDYVQAFTENLAYVVRTAREMQAKQTIARQIDRYGGHEEFVREAHVRSQEENARIAREMSRQIERDGAFELQSASPDVAALILEDGTQPEAGRVIVVHEPPDANGKVRTRYFEITDQAMYDMLSRVSEKDAEDAYRILQTLGKMFKGINNTFRNTTTLYNPQFAAKNMARDAAWTAISGNHKNAADAMSAWLRASREMAAYLSTGEAQSDEMRRYAALGGLGKDAYMHGEQSERVMMRELFSDREWNGKNIQGWAERTAQKGLDAIANFNDWAEGAQRYAQFIEGTRAGQSDLRAYIRSRDDTTDFSRRGSWNGLRQFGKMFNFFNAILQGTYDVGHIIEEGVKFDPQRLNRTMTRGVAVTMVAGMAARMIQMLLWSDEEKEKYDALAENIKAENWVIAFFGNRVLMVPKGQSPLFSLGDMLGRRIMDGMEKEMRDGGDWSSYLRHELGDDLADSMLTMIGDMNPMSSSVFRTIFDLGTNTNHWGESIVPSWMEGYEARNQTDAYTSEAANLLGRLTGYIPFAPETSPKMWHYIIDQQLGIVGDLILNATTPGKGYSTDGIAGFGRMILDMTVKGFANKVNVASSTYDDFQEYKDFFSTMLREWDDTDGDRDRMSGKINSSLTQKEYTQAYRDAEAMQEYLSRTYSALRKLYDAVDENPENADALTDEIVLLQVTAMHVAESWMRRYQAGDTSVEVRIPGRGK